MLKSAVIKGGHTGECWQPVVENVFAFDRVAADRQNTVEGDIVSVKIKMFWIHLWRPLYNALRRNAAAGRLHSRIILS